MIRLGERRNKMRVKGHENSRVVDEFALWDGKEELARSERLAFTEQNVL